MVVGEGGWGWVGVGGGGWGWVVVGAPQPHVMHRRRHHANKRKGDR